MEVHDAIIQASLAGDIQRQRAPAAPDNVIEVRGLHHLQHGIPPSALIRNPYLGSQPAEDIGIGGDPPQLERLGHGAETDLRKGRRDPQPPSGVGIASNGDGNERIDVAAARRPLGRIRAGGRSLCEVCPAKIQRAICGTKMEIAAFSKSLTIGEV